MPTYPLVNILPDGTRTFEKPMDEILAEVEYGGGIEVFEPEKYITHCQIAWWKGILLPALSKHSGDSTDWWESRLKVQVVPEHFARRYVAVGNEVCRIIPSISSLSHTKKGRTTMTKLIKGSVLHLHDKDMEGQPVEKPIYKGEYDWVTEPDSSLRK